LELEGKVAVVTGGGQGIGEAISLALGKAGADVIVWEMNQDSAGKVIDAIKCLGHQAMVIPCDVSNSSEVISATDKTVQRFKHIDILVNNAGVARLLPFVETTDLIIDTIMNTNLKGLLYCCREVGKLMVQRKQGKIINIASLSAHVSSPNTVAYSASKGGVIALTRTLAVEWGPHNVNVNAVSPGIVHTPATDGVLNFGDREKRTPLRRLQTPGDIAKAVLFLASPASDNITGQYIIVDGGMRALNSSFVWPQK